MTRLYWLPALGFCLLLGAAVAGERRQGAINLSNGEPFVGEVWFTDGKLRLYEGEGAAGGRYVNLTQGEVVSITFNIKDKSLESPWRFKNAGSDEKEVLPGKYPMINLGSEIKLTSGKILVGHLMTTPVFVRIPGRDNPMDYDNKKFILKYQYKGLVGQDFKDVTYVSSIVFGDSNAVAVAAADNGSISGAIKEHGKLEQAAAFGIERMAGYLGKVDAEKGTYCIENLPKDVYDIAVLTDQGIYVGLSDAAKTVKGPIRPLTPEDEQALAKQLAKYEDFFDQQQILGIKGHCEAAKVLVHQWRVKEQHDEEGLKGKQIHRLDIWCWHKRTTEWHTDKQGRAQLFRYMEPREGNKRAIRLVKEFGGIRVEPAEKKAVVVNYGGDDNAAPAPETKAEIKP